jgi:hypothetical protein
MLANFNETIEKVANVFYTQQVNVIVNDFSTVLIKPLLIMIANIIVLTILFVIAYKKKGLKN